MDVDASSEEDTTPENDPHPDDPREIAHGRCFSRRAHQIAGIISSFGHPAYFICNHSNGTGRPWKRELAKHGLFHVGDLKLNYHAWSLEQDGSLNESLAWAGYWKLTGLELISPVCQDVPEDWERILEVVGGVAAKIRVIESVTCGLHVHVVRDLDQLKRYCRKVSLSISTCQALNAKGQPPEQHEEEVYAKGTVEFRHLEGTMNPDLVLRWGQLAVAFFQFADLAKPDDWQKLISTALKCKDSRNYNLDLLDDFLQQLGLGEDFPFWEHRIRWFSDIKIPGESNLVLAFYGQPPLNAKFERAVSNEGMEALRKNICQRDRRPPYLAQEQEEIS
ncbi:hypothetical protein NW754_006528 [Fusarium falciforme]|nr:hypothetical protein NW754_006528 [Fusarium falciforme]